MDLTKEAESPVQTALGNTHSDVAGDVKQRTASGRLWVTRWEQPEWNFALLRAATVAGVHRFWRSGKTHGRLNRVKDAMALAFAKESNSLGATGEDPLTARSMWKRFEAMLQTAMLAEEYKKNMTCTEWEAFLKSKELRKGEVGYKKWAALHEYCTMLGWLPAGEDDPRYPKCEVTLQRAQGAHEDLKDLCAAHRAMLDMKDGKKVAVAAAADKLARKDTDGLALER